MSVLSESVVEVDGTQYKFSKVQHTAGTASTFKVDQSAVSVVIAKPSSGAPSVSLGSADSNFEKTVTLAAAGSSGLVTVMTTHSGTAAGTKP